MIVFKFQDTPEVVFDLGRCQTSFVSLQHLALVQDAGITRPASPGESPHYWVVYGCRSDSTKERIARFDNELLSLLFVTYLAQILGVFVEGKPFNLSPLESMAFSMNNKGASN